MAKREHITDRITRVARTYEQDRDWDKIENEINEWSTKVGAAWFCFKSIFP